MEAKCRCNYVNCSVPSIYYTAVCNVLAYFRHWNVVHGDYMCTNRCNLQICEVKPFIVLTFVRKKKPKWRSCSCNVVPFIDTSQMTSCWNRHRLEFWAGEFRCNEQRNQGYSIGVANSELNITIAFLILHLRRVTGDVGNLSFLHSAVSTWFSMPLRSHPAIPQLLTFPASQPPSSPHRLRLLSFGVLFTQCAQTEAADAQTSDIVDTKTW